MKATIGRILETLVKLSGDSSVTAAGVASLAFLSNFFLPVVPVVLTCFGLSFIDLCYGLKIAKREGRVESRRSWNGTIRKFRDTFTIIVAARGIELFILSNFTTTSFLVGGVALIIALTEFWSILENLNTVNPDGPWRTLGKFMRKKGSDVLNVDLDKILNDDNTNNKATSKTEAMGDADSNGRTGTSVGDSSKH